MSKRQVRLYHETQTVESWSFETEAYFGDQRGLGDRFRAKFPQEEAAGNASPPTTQLRSLSAVLAEMAYRNGILEKWMFLAHF